MRFYYLCTYSFFLNKYVTQHRKSFTLFGHKGKVSCVIQMADLRLASASMDNTIRVWNLASSKCELVLQGHEDYVFNICELKGFSDSAAAKPASRLASGSFDKTIKIWDLVTGACLMTLTGHGRTVRCVLQVFFI
jgi:WD40 repeat protein